MNPDPTCSLKSSVDVLEFTSDGALLVSGGADETLRLFDVGVGECIAVLQGHAKAISSISTFTPEGGRADLIASGSKWVPITSRLAKTTQCWVTLVSLSIE